ARAPPDGISTVVSARRVWIDGTVSDADEPVTCRVIAFSVERSDTSVMTFRLILPSVSTTGVKTRLTPNFLNVICGWQIGGDRVVSQDRPFGMGNSPPAMNVAVSPEIAVRLGSAKVRMTPARSMAPIVALLLGAGRVTAVLLKLEPVAENGLLVLKFSTAEP